MQLREAVREALRTLRVSWLRTVLTRSWPDPGTLASMAPSNDFKIER